MFRNQGAYTEDDSAALDDLSRKLATDLRRYVRMLAPHSLLTQDWMELVDSLQHITNIALMEQRLPKKADGTLWDRDELTVRFVLEEGKLNLCLRMMYEYKLFMRSPNAKRIIQQKATQELRLDQSVLEQRMQLFECSMGQLLSCAFRSVETLQTVDVPLLLQHIGDVLTHYLSSDEPLVSDVEKTQEALVFGYLQSLFQFLDDLPEDRIMDLVDQHDIVALATRTLVLKHGELTKKVTEAGCNALSLIMATEGYQTHKNRYVKTQETKDLLVQMKGLFLDDMTKEYEHRKKYQALLTNANSFS